MQQFFNLSIWLHLNAAETSWKKAEQLVGFVLILEWNDQLFSCFKPSYVNTPQSSLFFFALFRGDRRATQGCCKNSFKFYACGQLSIHSCRLYFYIWDKEQRQFNENYFLVLIATGKKLHLLSEVSTHSSFQFSNVWWSGTNPAC